MNFNAKMAVKATKGQICNGTISKIRFHKEYYLCGKFHNCITKCTKCPIFALCRCTIYLVADKYTVIKYTVIKYTVIKYTVIKYTVIKYTVIKYTVIKHS